MVVVVFVVAGSRPSPVNLPTSVSCNDNGGLEPSVCVALSMVGGP